MEGCQCGETQEAPYGVKGSEARPQPLSSQVMSLYLLKLWSPPILGQNFMIQAVINDGLLIISVGPESKLTSEGSTLTISPFLHIEKLAQKGQVICPKSHSK